jgi:hypothetical protein
VTNEGHVFSFGKAKRRIGFVKHLEPSMCFQEPIIIALPLICKTPTTNRAWATISARKPSFRGSRSI